MKKRLFDALAACQAIFSFTSGKSFDAYGQDLLLRSAVERQFEILGEALSQAARVEPGLTGRIPEVPMIVGLRNRIIHGYDSVDDEILWDIVHTKIVPLMTQLRGLLDEE